MRKRRFSVLNVLIVILSVILAVSIIVTIYVFRQERTVYYDSENSLYYSLSYGEYSSLVRRYYETAVGREEDPRIEKVADYYAVGRFFEKAFYANAFMKAQNPEKENLYRRQMEEIETAMGQFAGEKQKILQLFPDLQAGETHLQNTNHE